MRIVAISGWKRSGKDSIADYLAEKSGAIRIGFADPLKDAVAQEFGLTRAYIDDPLTKEAPLLHMPVDPQDKFTNMICEFMWPEFRDENGKAYGDGFLKSQLYWTPRALCILKGSTMRATDSNYWVRQALNKMTYGKLWVIPDVRYQSEFKVLKKECKDLVAIRVNRFKSSDSQDPSERDLDDYPFPHVIYNHGTLEELFKKIDMLNL